KKRHGRSPRGFPPHVCFPPTFITFDQGERLQEATSGWTSSVIALRNGFDCYGSFLLYVVESFAQLSSSLSVAVAESHAESVASAFAPWVLRERNLGGFRRRREQRRSRPGDRPVPQALRHDEDGACTHGRMDRPIIGQHGNVDLSLQNVE